GIVRGARADEQSARPDEGDGMVAICQHGRFVAPIAQIAVWQDRRTDYGVEGWDVAGIPPRYVYASPEDRSGGTLAGSGKWRCESPARQTAIRLDIRYLRRARRHTYVTP